VFVCVCDPKMDYGPAERPIVTSTQFILM